MIYLTHIRVDPDDPADHQHITDVRWSGSSSTPSNESSRDQVVDWINDGGDAWVREGFANVKVVVVIGAPPYMRTVANDTFTDHLLVLPRF